MAIPKPMLAQRILRVNGIELELLNGLKRMFPCTYPMTTPAAGNVTP
jgi:hypothetical protein